MSDTRGRRSFLYFWQRYQNDTLSGPILRLNQNSLALSEAQPGDELWAFAPAGGGRYAIVAHVAVARAGENHEGSEARQTAGRWFVEADPDGITYFDPAAQPDASALIRELDLRVDAAVLGQSFQGGAGVRRLTSDAAQVLATAAADLRPDTRLSAMPAHPRVNIRALRNRQAVLDAMAEHDRMAPGEFLRHYGYGDPDRFWIAHEGRRYPAKAILGVAWHYEDRLRPALRPIQFSSGNATVRPAAENLGFEVVEDEVGPDSGSTVADTSRPAGPRRGNAVRHWWVNHKQTHRQEIEGGYIWSPKRNANGGRNQTYDNMRRVVPGDIIFSYAAGQVRHVGVVTRPATPRFKPDEFRSAGANWNRDGWMVPVAWRETVSPLRPKEFIAEIRPHLPARHSPLRAETGDGLQNVYLAAVPERMAEVLLRRLGADAAQIKLLTAGAGDDDGAVRAADDALEKSLASEPSLDATEREAVVAARRGQGRFRLAVEAVERGGCRLTGVADRRLLRASHIKPWRSCATNRERLDGENGLLLTPTADHLFDRGYISFMDNGEMLLSELLDPGDLVRLGLPSDPLPNVGAFSAGQRVYLAFHRENVFLSGE